MRPADLFAFGVIWLCVATAAGPAVADTQAKPTPPRQPATGPGGSDYPFDGMRVTAYGEGAQGYWVLEPKGLADETLPVVLFVHGLTLTRYTTYNAWITHLVRRGNVVIYPRYQTGGLVDPTSFTHEAARAARQALDRCDGKRHARADPQRLTMIGHSLGGTIIANLAARPEHYGLPAPQALMLLQPGDTRADTGLGALMPSITEDHGTIAEGTLMLIVDVKGDWYVSPKAGQRIYDNAERIGPGDKRRLLLHSDAHGEPALNADHYLPIAWTDRPGRSSGHADAFDYALWRWFDALQAAAGGDARQRGLVLGDAVPEVGLWSDGVPVRRPVDAAAK